MHTKIIFNTLKVSSCTNSTCRIIPCDVCRKTTYPRTKRTKDCDWNRLSLVVAVPAKPTSKYDRELELIQSHFSAQKKNV